MPVDLFGKDSSSTPQGVDLFTQEPVDLFEEEKKKKKEPSLLDTIGDTLKNVNPVGGFVPSQMPEHPVDLFALGAVETLWNAPRKLLLELPVSDNLAVQQDLKSQELLAQIERDRKITAKLTEEAYGNDSTKARVIGGAIQSLPGTLAAALPAFAGVPLAPAMALGLGINMLTETASDFANRRDLGQTPTEALWGTTLQGGGFGHGAFATALEASPLYFGLKYLKNPFLGSGLRTLGKIGAGEFAQEALTQLYDEIAYTTEGLQPYDPWKSTKNIMEAGLSGMLMTPVMGGLGGARVHGARMELEYRKARAEKELNRALETTLGEFAGISDEVQQRELTAQVLKTLSNQNLDPEAVALQRAQMSGALANIPNTPFGMSLGQRLDALFGLKTEEAADVGGITPVVETRREEYLARGLQDTTPHEDRIFMGTTDDKISGLRLGQMSTLPDGFVGAISGSALSQTSLFPMQLPQAVVDTVAKWGKLAGMTDPILLTMEQLPKNKFGRYGRIALGDGRFAHVINPRELPSLKYGGNQTTVVEFTYALAHEFGHALKEFRFHKGIEEKALAAGLSQDAIRTLSETLSNEIIARNVTPTTLEQLRQVAPTEAALVETWYNLQDEARNERISARAFVDKWFGTRKFSLGLAKTMSTKDVHHWIERELGQRSIDSVKVKDVLQVLDGEDYALAFDEFMAEQFSRAAYDRNYLKGTTLGEWFQNALAKLKEFFGIMQDQGFIKPQETFNQWLDEQTALAKLVKRGRTWGKVKLDKQLRAAQKAQLAQLEAERAALALEGELEVTDEESRLPDDEEVNIQTSPVVNANEAWLNMWKGDLDPKDFTRLKDMLAKGQTKTANEELTKLIGAKLHFDKSESPEDMWDMGSIEAAGLSEQYTLDEIKEAARLWQTLKFDSPYFKSWWRNGKLLDAATGDPIYAWHGTGQVLTFFDPTLLGRETAAESAKKAFFFSANPANALSFAKSAAEGAGRLNVVVASETAQRRLQQLRRRIQAYEELQKETYKNGKLVGNLGKAHEIPAHVWGKKIREVQAEISFIEETSRQINRKPVVRPYYLRMENPYIVDYAGQDWHEGVGGFSDHIERALAGGYDGVVFKNALDPELDTVYAVFEPEQIKDAQDQVGTFGHNDLLMWDKQNPIEAGLAQTSRVLDGLSDIKFSKLLNGIKRISDAFVELQQRASQPLPDGTLDLPMQRYNQATLAAEAFKNSLQVKGETLVKELWKRSKKELDQIYNVLDAEWRSGKLSVDLVGWDTLPENLNAKIIWGNLEDGGRDVSAATGKQVQYWDFMPTTAFMDLLAEHGIAEDSEVAQLVLDIKIAMLEQFTALERVLTDKILHRWGNAPLVAARELESLYQVMQKIRMTPFLPQGWYGDWVVSIQEKKANPAHRERKYKLVRVEYYQTEAQALRAFKKWYAAKAAGMDIKVSYKSLEQMEGIPLQLPRNLLDQLEKTGEFTKDQLGMMEEFMVPVGHTKLEQRYAKWTQKLFGGEKDILRNFANFTWHNANYIWKLKFRHEFTRETLAQKALWKKAQQTGNIAQAQKLHRNLLIMERVTENVLHPPYEFQQIRQGVALMYLAYNGTTALMNGTTMALTYAGMTTEYGEIKGHVLYVKGLHDATRIWSLQNLSEGKTLSAQDSEMMWMYDRAIKEGVIDQSYAYFLASQATGGSHLQKMRRGNVAKLSYWTQVAGMAPFRSIEKGNRLSTLTMFFEAERAVRKSDLETAYQIAVKRTNLLQNAYNAANRSEVFRGKRALVTMFASYIQSMAWHFYGGYSNAVKAELKQRGLKSAEYTWVYTLKIWMLFTLLGGMFAGPGMEDLMEVIVWLWRKWFGTNARLELRQFIKELGGGGHWYNDPDLITHGLLSNVAGMDLSARLSLGRMLPGISMVNREWRKPEEWMGTLMVKGAGPFGGWTESVFGFIGEFFHWAYQGFPATKAGEAAKELPGELGALGRAYDAWVKQQLNPTGAVLDKSGARVVEDPPGSGEFRDLTTWELIGMALNANPAVLARSREMNFYETGEYVYWVTRQQKLLDDRWDAVNTKDEKLLATVDKMIEDYNDSLPKGYERLRITGKMIGDSIRTHRKTVRKKEQGRAASKRYQPLMDYVKESQ